MYVCVYVCVCVYSIWFFFFCFFFFCGRVGGGGRHFSVIVSLSFFFGDL